jgi:hypothetical protein
MPKSNRKSSAKSSPVVATVPSVELPISVVEETVAVETPAVVTSGKKDAYGFGIGSEVSYLANALKTGTFTKTELLASFLRAYSNDPAKTGDVKAKKTSFSVFFSDVKRPVGTYYASRSFLLVTSETGILSLDPKRDDTVREAIGAGLLSDLRGKTKSAKVAVLKAAGLPYEG